MVDVGIDHALADPGVLHRPIAILGDVHLVLFVIAPGGVVVDDQQHRRALMNGAPDGAGGHDEIAVAHQSDAEFPGVAAGDGRARHGTRSIADAAAAVGTEIRAGARELPDAFRKTRLVAHCEQPVLVLHRVPQLGHHAARPDRLVVPTLVRILGLTGANNLVALLRGFAAFVGPGAGASIL